MTSDQSDTAIDHLIAVYERLRPYHTPSVLVLAFAGLVNFWIELPVYVWLFFLCYFGVNLAGNMAKQRREQRYV